MGISNRLIRLADYIREKTNTTEKLTLDEILELIPKLGDESIKGYYDYITITNPGYNGNGEIINTDYYIPSIDGEELIEYNFIDRQSEGINVDTLHLCNCTYVNNSFNSINLNSIDMKYNKLEKIDNSFKELDINNIEFPDSLHTIIKSFDDCENLKSIKFGDGIKIIKDSFNNTNPDTIILPDEPVLLDNIGFLDHDDIDSAYGEFITNNVELYEDGFYVFKGTHILAQCDLIYSDIVNVPQGITTIGQYCFKNFIAREINLPNTVVAIGSKAFYNCKYISTINIPNSVKMIGYDIFDGCEMLKQININYNNLEYLDQDTDFLEYILADLNNYDTSIINENNYAIINTPLPNVISNYQQFIFNTLYISDNITKIDDYAFNGSAVSTIVIGDGSNNYISNLEYIGDHAFQNCALEVRPFTYKSNNITTKLYYIGKYAFANNGIMYSFHIPYSVVEIDDYAFYNCGFLITTNDRVISDIYFENDIKQSRLERIGKYAFAISNDNKNTALVSEVNIPASVTTIDDHAFSNQNMIKKVQFENNSNLEYLGDYVFDECSSLESINIPEGITRIGDGAFYNCTSLTSIVIPEGVTEIGDRAFYGCTSLTSVTLPSTLVSIGKHAFYGCILLDNISLPDSLTTLGYYCFYNCNSLTNVTLPPNFCNILKNDDEISPQAIDIVNSTYTTLTADNCKLLMRGDSHNSTINIPEGITKIGDFAFYNCNMIENITIPEGVTEIGDYAFYGCTSLTSINIPDSVTKIGELAFYNCTNLIFSISIENDIIIGEKAFKYCRRLTSINIPKGIINSTTELFNNCYSLTSAIIPEGVTEIGNNAFDGCSSLTSVTIPESVTRISDRAFYGCELLTSVIIPEGVTEIGKLAFYRCTALTSINIPDGVTKIGNQAFSVCSVLNNIIIPNNVTEIGEATFASCKKLSNITLSNNITKISKEIFKYCSSLTNINIPDGVTEIDNLAFSECTALTNINIPDSVTNINFRAFYKCTALTSITIPDSVTKIGSGAFNDCTALTSITIPDSVTIIDSNAFSGCTSLTSIVIPEGVTIIGNSAFSGCTSLTSIVIPEGVTEIDSFAFYKCTALTNINIPDSVTEIGYEAFSECTALTSITIPDSVTEIGDYTFDGCISLSTVYMPAKFYRNEYTNPSSNIFKYCDNLNNIIITNDKPIMNSIYTGATFVNDTNLYDILLNSSYIAPNSFEYNDNLVNITIPSNITTIGPSAFYCCGNLESVTFLNENICIYDSAFSGCTSLTSINFKNNKCKYIGKEAFEDCNIENLTFPIVENMYNIHDKAFNNCNIEQIEFDPLTEEFNASAFSNCYRLKRIVIPSNIKSIGVGFFQCFNLKYIYFNYLYNYSESLNNIYYGTNLPYLCEYGIDNLPEKVIILNNNSKPYKSNSIISIDSPPFNINIPYGNEKLHNIRYANIINLGTNTIIFNADALKISINESGTYSISISDTDPEYDEDVYYLTIYDLTDGTLKTMEDFGFNKDMTLLVNLISNHEYYFNFNADTDHSGNVTISKHSGNYTELIENVYCPITNPLILSEGTTLHIYYENNNIINNYNIIMNTYDSEEQDYNVFLSYYGNLDRYPIIEQMFNCTKSDDEFPFFMYIDHDGYIHIFTENTPNQDMPIIEITMDMPEEVYDDNGGGSTSPINPLL